MKASVFVGTSLDGFLARPDGGLDFLSARGFRHLDVDGGITIQGFLRTGLVQSEYEPRRKEPDA